MTLRKPYSFRMMELQNDIKDFYYPWQDAREGIDRRGENRRKYDRRSLPRPLWQSSEQPPPPITYHPNLLTQEEREFIEYLSRNEEELNLLP